MAVKLLWTIFVNCCKIVLELCVPNFVFYSRVFYFNVCCTFDGFHIVYYIQMYSKYECILTIYVCVDVVYKPVYTMYVLVK